MKKVMVAAALAAFVAAPAMANDLKISGDDLAVLSTQGTGLGALGVTGTVALTTLVVTTLVVAGGSSSSTTTN